MSGSTREMRHTEDGHPEWNGPWVEGYYETLWRAGVQVGGRRGCQ